MLRSRCAIVPVIVGSERAGWERGWSSRGFGLQSQSAAHQEAEGEDRGQQGVENDDDHYWVTLIKSFHGLSDSIATLNRLRPSLPISSVLPSSSKQIDSHCPALTGSIRIRPWK